MKKFIPNLLTLLNLFCGCIAIVFATEDNLEMAALFVFLGIFFDFFDGFAARILNAQSELGLQLDSLADMVTSGVVPGVVLFKLLHLAEPEWHFFEYDFASSSYLPYAGFLVTLGAAYRLAKFNIDENQVDSFIGLPTPAFTLFVLSLPLIISYQGNDLMNSLIVNKWFLLAVIAFGVFVMNAPIKLFALKFKNSSFKDNAVRYTFLLLSIVLLVVLQFAAIPLIIILYILLSVLVNRVFKV
ncbi:CDP-alcohol phosphatidyltransferase family protein [Ascidiimonas sp. W6]|uniref:CDP-alcohol phosphatidyltransferase family protein n=1 Tax=Ascidiimonas meishanensis TaxID=3128903 RepID=UPI0030EC1389